MNGLVLSLHIGGSGAVVGSGALTPPTLAPVLTASVGFGQTNIDLDWTASNKTDSPGFGYNLYYSTDGDIFSFSSIVGAIAIFFASINIFGGFMVTQRMLDMFKKKEKNKQ